MDNMNIRIKHNREVITNAEYRAAEMRYSPSPLEERMKLFLDRNGIMYETQKVFYIRANDGYILKYYIADFYIPHKEIIIEVDRKFHDKHKQHDKKRTKEIQKQYPTVEVLRYKWKDLFDKNLMNELLAKIF